MTSPRSRHLKRGLLAAIVLLDAGYILSCLGPYLHLKYEFSQAMFSMLEPAGENHVLMPSLNLFDNANYVWVDSVRSEGGPPDELRGLSGFLAGTRATGTLVHLGFLKYHLSRLCRSPGTRVIAAWRGRDGKRESSSDVCADPELRHYLPIGLYPACDPDCSGLLRNWAAGKSLASGEGETP
jgi:hypothetical protein